MNNIEGKVALVTGGRRGIGGAVVVRLAQEGADVVLTYQQSAEQAAAVVDQVKAAGRRAMATRFEGRSGHIGACRSA